MPRFPLRALLLLTACLGATARADVTVAPTPLYASPTLGGPPVLTLPPGKPVTVLRSSGGGRPVVTIPYGERVLYARGGNVRSTAGPVRLSGPQWYLPPQPSARPVTVYLSRESNAAQGRAADWEVRVLPLAPSAPGETGLRVTGGALRSVRVGLAGTKATAPLGALAPGRYLVTASRADAPAAVLAAEVMEVTDLALTTLTTPAGLWVWSTRLDDGRVLPGVRLRAVASLFGPEGERVSSRSLPPVTTDARGLAFLPQRDGERLAVYGDAALGGLTHRAALGTGEYGLWSGDETRARTFVQTDKPVYRPGETLRGLAVARRLGPGTRVPYRGPVTVRLVDDGYPALTLAWRSANADADGLVTFEFPLPEDVRVGEYRVEVEVPGPSTPANPAPAPDIASLPVRVQAFVKPQFTLDLGGPAEVVTGEPLPVSARAELYAGGGATVRADAFLGGGYGEGALWPGAVNTGNPNDRFHLETQSWAYWRSSPDLNPGQKPAARLDITSGQGQASLRPTATGGVPRVYTVVVRARDEYGRDVLASREVTVHPAGLKFELPGFPTQTGEEVRARVLVRQVGTNAPLAGRPVGVTVVRAYSEPIQVEGRTEYRNREEVVSRREARSGAGGALDLAFRAGKPGAYLVRLSARDAAARAVRATFQAAFVPEPAPTGQARTLTLGADRTRYAVGDTARLTLRTDLPPGTPLLLSANVEGRVTPRLVRVTGRELRLDWKVTPDLAPGLTFSAAAVFGADSLRAGTDLLYVPRTDRQLDVTVIPEKANLRPGEETILTVRTRQGGRPVPALVTLAVVNESVYALAEDPSPDPWRLLWGASYPAVQVYSTAGAPADGGGGGGGGAEGGVPRQDLREVALFRTVATGQDGAARVQVRLPEALGGYRVSARALTREGGAGASRGEVRAELPFALRLARPRVLTQGDAGRAAVSVLDRTGPGGSAGQGTVTLGLGVGGREGTRTLPLNAGAASTLFPLTAPGTGRSVLLDAWAQRGEHRDALRETLPLREAGPRTLLARSGAQAGPGLLTDPLTWPGGAGVESLVVDLAATPLQAALGGLDAHLADPEDRWVTTDGVAARLGANLDLAAIGTRLGWPDVAARALGQARRDLASLLALRGQEGWGWTAGSAPDAEMTARALSALAQAKGTGLTDAATLTVAAGNARRLLAKAGTGEPERVLLAAALARTGDPSAALGLARAGGPTDPVDTARLAAALAPVAPDLARPLYTRARRAAQTTTTGTLVLGDAGGWRGDTEPTALLLEAGAALGQAADVAPLTQALLDRKTGAAWPGPLGTGAALRALRRVVEGETAGRQPSAVTLRIGTWEQTGRVGAPLRVVVPPEAVKAGEPLTLQGDGPLAFRRELRVRAKDTTPAAPSLVHVERRYDRTRVERDGVVTVTLTVRADVGARHLRVTDPLPGGLEAVDDRPFAYPGSVNPPRSGAVAWAERSIYDDRAVFYLERVAPGVTTIRYQLRALAPGRYTAPAPRVDLAGGGVPAVGSAEAVEVLE
ncbi:MG2 domain-containing protein [Deinococcus planocerae]|uniref:MG2 domain-containing protein n=1 Tax=Deinococcus planocerae TaxID=1737569 RepID=UPI000C7EC4B4|nr:MG2 domain-containing protein [Deinococcus planocerae]